MSDGISVISDGDGHNTPPESDATADIAAERVSEDRKATGGRVPGFFFEKIRSGSGYRPLTPPNTPPTEEDHHELVSMGDKKKKKEKLDVESYFRGGTASGNRFIGIYPRHVVFLMVICGIIGGMIGHLWNTNYGCHCDKETHQGLVEMYNRVVEEKWRLQQELNNLENGYTEYRGKSEQAKWSGHEETDEYVKVEDEPEEHPQSSTTTESSTSSTTTPKPSEHKYIPSDQFESMIWQHLRETDPNSRSRMPSEGSFFGRKKREVADGGEAGGRRQKRSKEEASHENDSKEYKQKKTHKKYDSKKGRFDISDEEGDDSHEKAVNYKGDRKQQKESYKQGSGVGEEKKKYKSKEDKYRAKQFKNSGEGVGSGASKQDGKQQKQWRGESDEDDSKENGKQRQYNDRKYQQHKKKKEGASGEWSQERNRGRDELRQQEQGNGKKNWYLERGAEREINRVETSSTS